MNEQDIIDAYRAGQTAEEISHTCGYTIGTVYGVLRRRNVPRRRRGRRVKTAPNDTDRIVLRLLSEGLNQTDIARRLGVTQQAVSGRIKRIPRESA